MPFSKNAIDGTRIHYEVAGSGPPLLLIHGFGGSIFSWTESPYADALKFSYRLVMYDMRAHGHSGHPHGVEAYTPEMHVADALAVLDELGIEKSHVSGYSMGAWVGFGLLKYAPERMRSFVAGANHPYPRSDYPTDDNWIELYREGLEAVLDTFEVRARAITGWRSRCARDFWRRILRRWSLRWFNPGIPAGWKMA